MQKEYILQASLLDIVFDNRNKKYGAYELRKFYGSRLGKALSISFGLAVIFSALALFIKPSEKISEMVYLSDGHVLRELLVERPELPKPPAAKIVKQAVPAGQAPSANIQIVDNAVAKPITLNGSNGPDLPPSEPGEPGPPNPPSTSGTGTVTPAPEPIVVKPDPNIVHSSAEVMPAFPGGLEALRKFLEKNLRNPDEVADGEVVSVKIRFIVGYDGLLKGFQTVEDGGEQFNQEVIRVLKKMPAWIPGKTKGEFVSVYYTIPVKFTGAD